MIKRWRLRRSGAQVAGNLLLAQLRAPSAEAVQQRVTPGDERLRVLA
jgi:hypothetical protein